MMNEPKIDKTKRDYLMGYQKIMNKVDRWKEKLYSLDSKINLIESPHKSKAIVELDLKKLNIERNDILARINDLLETARTERLKIECAIDQLINFNKSTVIGRVTASNESLVMLFYFIENNTFANISEIMGYNYRHVMRIYVKGVNNISLPVFDEFEKQTDPNKEKVFLESYRLIMNKYDFWLKNIVKLNEEIQTLSNSKVQNPSQKIELEILEKRVKDLRIRIHNLYTEGETVRPKVELIINNIKKPIKKEVATLLYIKGLKYEEIANKLKYTPQTIYTIKRRIIKSIPTECIPDS